MALHDPNKPAKNVNDDKRTGFTFRGKEIVLTKVLGAPKRGLVAKGMEKGIYPEEKRIEAVTLFAATGNMTQVQQLTGVPLPTLRYWRKQPWFLDLLHEIRQENNAKLDSKFNEIIDGALDQLTDRVRNGDYHVLRDGTLIRKPISAKDLSLVAAINVDKRQLLRGEATQRTESVGKIEDKTVSKLEQLATTFENLAKFGRQPKVIEHEDAQLITVEPDGGGTDGSSPEGHPEEQVQEGETR